jgi:putative transposase
LRQQLAVLAAKHPQPRLAVPDRLLWVILRRLWPDWKRALVIVQPQTVVRWHRGGFKVYWNWISRKHTRAGRKPTTRALRELIFRMEAENPTWGAPRIHGGITMFGFEVSERTVLRWMRKAHRTLRVFTQAA